MGACSANAQAFNGDCSTAVHCSTAVLSRLPTSFSLTLLSWAFQTRLASSAPRRLRTIVEHYCSTANCSTAVLSRLPTSFSLALLSWVFQTRLASSAPGRLRTIVEHFCSTAVLSRLPTSFSLALLSWIPQTRLASSAPGRLRTTVEHYCSTEIVQRLSSAVCRQALAWRCFPGPSDSPRKLGIGTIEDNRRTLLFDGDCSTAVLSRLPTSFSLALLSWVLQTRLASSAPRRLRTIVEHYCSTEIVQRQSSAVCRQALA